MDSIPLYWCFECQMEVYKTQTSNFDLVCNVCNSAFIVELEEISESELHNLRQNNEQNLEQIIPRNMLEALRSQFTNSIRRTNINTNNREIEVINISDSEDDNIQVNSEINSEIPFSNEFENVEVDFDQPNSTNSINRYLMELPYTIEQLNAPHPNLLRRSLHSQTLQQIQQRLQQQVTNYDDADLQSTSRSSNSSHFTSEASPITFIFTRGSLNNNLSSQLLADAFSTRFGDYVFNDEALDNVISQIMEEYSAYGPPPANNDAISSLTNFIIDAKSLGKEPCAVCLECWHVGDTGVSLHCSHEYHKICLIPWLELHGTCPVCRASVN